MKDEACTLSLLFSSFHYHPQDQHLLTPPSNPIADDLTIQVGLAYPRGGDKIVLRASSSREAHAWLSEIDTQSKRCRDAERKATIKAQQRNSRQY